MCDRCRGRVEVARLRLGARPSLPDSGANSRGAGLDGDDFVAARS
jgi:hypothetical protein